MIIDSSAIVALILGEADALRFAEMIGSTAEASISAVNWLEAAMVIDRRGGKIAGASFDRLFGPARIQITDFSWEQGALARDAWRRFGKGSGHKAQLNFGDCMAYALAKHRNQPLLFKGGDFSLTDVEPALKD